MKARFAIFSSVTAFCLFWQSIVITDTANAQETDKSGESAGEETAQRPVLPRIPDDLLDDEHVREEFGVNSFTAPSIRKLFEDLDDLGNLPYDEVKRKIDEKLPKRRSQIALSLGMVIAEGFLVVQSEKLKELQDVGRSALRHARALGTGDRITKHSKTILEKSALGEWDDLKAALATTQRDVEGEMVSLRDEDIAHLVSLGGYLRALELTARSALKPYSAKKARKLARYDVVDYFAAQLETLSPQLLKEKHIQELRKGILELRDMMDIPDGRDIPEAEVKKFLEKAQSLVKIASS